MVLQLDLSEASVRLLGGNFKPFQRSQLRAWGFDFVEDHLVELPASKITSIVPKLINYLAKQGIEFEATEHFSRVLADLSDRETGFSELKQACREFKDSTVETTELRHFNQFCAQHIARKLKRHQKKAAYHLYLAKNGANFSVPGSGKTSVVLTTFEKLRQEGKVNLLFVVGPPACFSPWVSEFAETLDLQPDARVLAGGDIGERKEEYYRSTEQLADLYLTTFQTLLNDQNEINTFFSQSGVRPFLVIDEAHYIKQLDGNWARAVLNVAKHAAYRCVLTGTPMPKSFSDVYNLFDFLWPDYHVVDGSSRVRIQTFEKENELEQAKEILHSKIGPLFYRVRKTDLGLKPPIFHDPIVIPMGTVEGAIYEAIQTRIRSYQIEDQYQDLEVLDRLKRARIIRLRQCVSYAKLVGSALSDDNEDLVADDIGLARLIRKYDELELPAKLKYLIDMVQRYNSTGLKLLVWTNFVGTIEKMEKYFNDQVGIRCKSIYGKTPIARTSIEDELTREEIREEFMDPNSGLDLLIANPAACAESISLHKTCHMAIYYDLSYNCAQYLQSLDRIHRVGGSEKTIAHYYFLQYANSIDQDILTNLRRKAEKMSQIIDADYGVYDADMFAEDDDDIAAYDRLFGS